MPEQPPNPGNAHLIEFIRGTAGPPAVAFLGARLKVTAVLLYADGIRVECLVAPLPEASKETVTQDQEGWIARARPHEAAGVRGGLRDNQLLLRHFGSARLTDELGHEDRRATPSRSGAVAG